MSKKTSAECGFKEEGEVLLSKRNTRRTALIIQFKENVVQPEYNQDMKRHKEASPNAESETKKLKMEKKKVSFVRHVERRLLPISEVFKEDVQEDKKQNAFVVRFPNVPDDLSDAEKLLLKAQKKWRNQDELDVIVTASDNNNHH